MKSSLDFLKAQSLIADSNPNINLDDRTFWEGHNSDWGWYCNSGHKLEGDVNFNDSLFWEINSGKFTSVPHNG